MPPSHRSSSSHHSSSHSSSSSHTSSSHSHSSHSSSSYSSSRSSYGSSYSSRVTTARTRVNQPTGFKGSPNTYRCKTHDYSYYNTNWMDEDLGKSYRRGYYDENGNYYDALIIKDAEKYMSHFQCAYCGTEKKAVWTEGSIPHCDNCGANFMEMYTNPITDELSSGLQSSYNYQGSKTQRDNNRTMGCLVKFILVTIGVNFLSVLLTFCASFGFLSNIKGGNSAMRKLFSQSPLYVVHDNDNDDDDDDDDDDNGTTISNDNVDRFGTSIYVESIDRTLEWYDEYDSYYDSVSDCYVAYNTSEEPFAWQYWYESISSDYGDYGWMEYELEEDQWYIEIDDGRWTKLPSKYDTSELWYITGDLAGSSYTEDIDVAMFGTSISDADNLGYIYNWDSDWRAFYNENYECYFWYNADYIEEPQWQYYFTNLEGTMDDMTGWFEYDRDEELWYYETTDGTWVSYEGDTSDLWYFGTRVFRWDIERIVECN